MLLTGRTSLPGDRGQPSQSPRLSFPWQQLKLLGLKNCEATYYFTLLDFKRKIPLQGRHSAETPA